MKVWFAKFPQLGRFVNFVLKTRMTAVHFMKCKSKSEAFELLVDSPKPSFTRS